jgi:endonuclease/exonuclease/phosphatase family metal-dependent hydrolase
MRYVRTAPLLLALALLVGPGCDTSGSDEVEVRVMSQNLYLGADLFLVAGETNPTLVPVRVAQLYQTVQQSAVELRMEAVAAEIAAVRPALVGLQEVSTYAVQSPADNLPGGAATPATDVTIDFLEILLEALENEGESYVVASVSENSDVELPATNDGGQTFFDLRYQDADVILRRADVDVSDATETTFQVLLTQPVGGVDQTFVRGYQSVEATVDGLAFTFVNTHLEVGGAAGPVQEAQAVELAAAVAATDGRVVLVGDLNSDAGGTGTDSYATITASLVDAFGEGDGTPTCCQDADLRNEASDHTTRIDLILHRGFDEVAAAETFFTDPEERVGVGIWPSDHAGVWAELEAETDGEAS